MAKVQAFSSVSVIDLTDVGVINLYLTSNQPTSVIYDPDQNTYTPDWSSSNLVITPVISYNGSNLALNATGVSIEFKRKEGSGNAGNLVTGESVTGGVLTVSANKLSSVTSGQLTYICKVEYTDPDVGVPISAEAVLTYSLITMASEVKYASISGESAFLYDTNRAIVGADQITLTADLTNVSVVQWQYKKSDGTFAAFPTTYNASISGTTLLVKESEQDIWLNGKMAVIKLVTSEGSVYDLHQINKIYDGAEGSATVTAILTNESHYLPCNPDGSVRSWNGSSTTLKIYEGGVEDTSSWTITYVNGNGLTGTFDAATSTYTPTGLTQDTSYVDFTAKKSGNSDISKRFTITKQIQGADGKDAVIYELEPDYYAINQNEAGVYTPTSVTFSGYMSVGNSTVRSNYSGRFIISESTNGVNFTTKYTSGSNEHSKTHVPTSTNVSVIKCVLYLAGGTTTILDEQSVVVTKDGNKGQDGDDGTDGLSVGLNNYADVLPCDTSGKVVGTRDITIPFYAYKGIVRVPVTATVGTLPSGVTTKSNSPGTAATDGQLVLTVANGATFGDASLLTGDITITLSAEGRTVDQKYCWTKSKQGVNGTSAVILQLYSEDGGVVKKGKSTTIKTQLTSGSGTVTPSAVAWASFSEGSYKTIDGETGTSIVITDSMVTDQLWLRCTATYNGNPYVAYYTVDDVEDEYTAYTFATIDQFKNSQGYGAVYTRVYQNGVEVDPIKSTTFSNTPPSSPSTGDFYYHLDTTNKTCVLKKYDGSAWANATETDEFTYKYYRTDNKGDSLDTTTPYKVGRCIYVDPSIINGRMQFICEVND